MHNTANNNTSATQSNIYYGGPIIKNNNSSLINTDGEEVITPALQKANLNQLVNRKSPNSASLSQHRVVKMSDYNPN